MNTTEPAKARCASIPQSGGSLVFGVLISSLCIGQREMRKVVNKMMSIVKQNTRSTGQFELTADLLKRVVQELEMVAKGR